MFYFLYCIIHALHICFSPSWPGKRDSPFVEQWTFLNAYRFLMISFLFLVILWTMNLVGDLPTFSFSADSANHRMINETCFFFVSFFFSFMMPCLVSLFWKARLHACLMSQHCESIASLCYCRATGIRPLSSCQSVRPDHNAFFFSEPVKRLYAAFWWNVAIHDMYRSIFCLISTFLFFCLKQHGDIFGNENFQNTTSRFQFNFNQSV